jgi:hypothetical protein
LIQFGPISIGQSAAHKVTLLNITGLELAFLLFSLSSHADDQVLHLSADAFDTHGPFRIVQVRLVLICTSGQRHIEVLTQCRRCGTWGRADAPS